MMAIPGIYTRPRVLFVLPTLGTGGSERVVYNLSLHCGPQFQPVVAAFRDGALSTEMRAAGIPVHVLDRSGGIDVRLIMKLVKLIRQYRVQIVNSHHFVSLFYAFWATRWLKVPLFHTEHSRWEMERLSRFWNCWFRYFLGRIEGISAVSEESHAYLREVCGVREPRLALTRNGIDIAAFAAGNGHGLSRESLGLHGEDFVIGSVGNLRPEKNQGLVIRAVAVLKSRGYRFKAVLVGDGPCRDELERLTAELGVTGQVRFLGVRHDVPHLYSLFHLYCLPSRYEGLPLTVLEAMAASLPVIGTDVLGIREVISDGENGLLVADDDAAALADAIVKLADDQLLRKRLSRNGQRYVQEHYLLQHAVDRYKELFRQLVAEGFIT